MEAFLTNHQFTVKIGSNSYGFAKVSNLVQEQEYDSIQEGGRNWSPVFFRKPKSKFDTLVLEKGVKATAPVSGAKLMEVGMKLSTVIITIGGDDAYLCYSFDKGIVTKLELDNLDAMGNSVLIRKVEIAHTGLKRVTPDTKKQDAKP